MEYILLFLFLVNVAAQVLVTLPQGQIKGHEVQSFTNKPYQAFEGIPFAKPPLGPLRFQAPEAPDNWNDTLETTELKHCCYSVTRDFDRENEDCLYLNVFTPILDREINASKLPVVFWIYGGGFINGCADWWPQYWMDEDIVVVIPNYRVGPFGFLATGDLSAPGNAGLKDQSLALKWTYENVHLFGGDNDRITIAGQSAGGSSVGWQLLSDKSQSFFRAAIIESGSPLNTWAYQDDPYSYAINLANTIDSTITELNTNELVEFLQGVDSKTIDVASTAAFGKQALPVIEPYHAEAFISAAMFELFDSGTYTQVPTIIGVNSEEKITLAKDLAALIKYAEGADEAPSALVPANFNYKADDSSYEVGKKIRSIYVGNETLAEHLGQYIRLSSDNQYTRSVIKQGKLMAKYNDVFFYVFAYDGEAGGVNATFPGADSVAHAEELKYNWSTVPLAELNDQDRLVHYRMMRLWVNFVKYLNPTPVNDDLLQNVTWRKVSEDSYNFLNLNESLSLEQNPKGDHFIGWNSLFEEYAQRPFKTY
nr:carboxylesterase COEA2 [Dendroctonus rhizophagus]